MIQRVFIICQLILFFSTILVFPRGSEAKPLNQDPYATIETIELKNGLKIFFAPSQESTLTEIRVEVDVGWDAEAPKDWGVSHLLEHVLFRDKQLKDEMSYLQLIREAGGEANGSTESRLTSFYGSIPAKKGEWLLQTFSKMILAPSITDEYVEKEKGTVELERGKPSPITQLLGFNPRDYLFPSYLHNPDFWETEFDIHLKQPFTDSEEQLSTQKLTRQQVETHYHDYYYPANMRIFVAGKFNRRVILKQLKADWDPIPARNGKKLPPLPVPQSNGRSYQRATITTLTPTISIGTKFTQIDQLSLLVTKSYIDYLAHRLMKELRNLKGQTYTANGDYGFFRSSGFALINFQTPPENLQDNIELVKHYLVTEAQNGNLTPQQIQETKDLYLSQFLLSGREAGDMMALAGKYWSIINEYGKFYSPYQQIKDISDDEYKAKLQNAFKPALKYEAISEPPFFFHYDQFFIYVLTALVTFRTLRSRLLKEFFHDRIRWVRKIKYPPLKIVELSLGFVSWFAFIHLIFPYTRLFEKIEWLGSSVLLNEYLKDAGAIVIALLCTQGIISLVPRKLLVMNSNLIIKSLSYYSKSIPLSEIASVETRSLFGIFCSPSTLWHVKYRFFYFNPMFWQRGLLVQLKNGKFYFLSVTAPERARAELQKILTESSPINSPFLAKPPVRFQNNIY